MNHRTISMCIILLLMAATAVHAEGKVQIDPFVLLDQAKLTLGEGKLDRSLEQLSEIPTGKVEEYVDEEIVFHRLLINAAFLSATHFVLMELTRNDLGNSGYAEWLSDERSKYTREFTKLAGVYLELTKTEPALDFVRFRLPRVTAEHINDVELYTDPEILGPASTNWDDGRTGLGKGIIAGQARVALVLSAARYYDMDSAAINLELISSRLRSGVPLDYILVLDWIAEIARTVDDDNGLIRIAEKADERLLELAGLDDQTHIIRAEIRLGRREAPQPESVDESAEETDPPSGSRNTSREELATSNIEDEEAS